MANSASRKRKVDDEHGQEDEATHKARQGGGMAWGPSRAATAAQRKPRKDDEIGFGDFDRYMSEKIRKLRGQFDVDACNSLLSGPNSVVAARHSLQSPANGQASGAFRSLFAGVSIYVDGFTIPSHQELRHLMLLHGGVFENYFSRSRVTHVICSTLPDSKIKDPKLLSRGLPILKPSWILDSIKAGKLLPFAGHELERIAYQHPHQRTLPTSFLPSKNCEGLKDSSHMELLRVSEAHEGSDEPRDSTDKPDNDEGFELLDDMDLHIEEIQHVMEDQEEEEYHLPKDVLEGKTYLACGAPQMDIQEEKGISSVEDSAAPNLAAESTEDLVKRKLVDDGLGTKENSHRGPRSHSTLGDPKFVQNYYKFSRLHFIGTWRDRYKQLFGDIVHQAVKEPSSSTHQLANSAIVHIDMDCFFVSVVIRNRPELSGKPVAVCHSDSAQGTAEISSANYPARAFGIAAGMFVKTAKARCPHLEIVPYDFEGYEQVAEQFYRILHQHSNNIQAVSCDEAYLDVTGLGDPGAIAAAIRQEVFSATKCPASAGIGGNKLLARLATSKAKPNGQYRIFPDQVELFMANLPVGDLPGVGGALEEKLKGMGIANCRQLQASSKESLQRELGAKTGSTLWSYSRGIDERQVQQPQERKSIGAEVNWGVRFSCQQDAKQFLTTLCEEVSERLQKAGSLGRTFTLKVKRRKEGVGEPTKFMGCGICDSMSRSATVASATDSADVLLRASQQLFASLNLDVCDVRGVGLQVSRLEQGKPGHPSKGGQGQKVLKSWLQAHNTSETRSEGIHTANGDAHSAIVNHPHRSPKMKGTALAEEDIELMPMVNEPIKVLNLPPVSELDRTVLACLPPEILSEIQEAYTKELGSTSSKAFSRREDMSCDAYVSNSPSSRLEVTTTTAVVLGSKDSGGALVRRLPEQPPVCAEHRVQESHQNLQRNSARAEDTGRVEALPPPSQLDHSVMGALPLALRRELEFEYKRLSVQGADTVHRADASNVKRSSGTARSRKKAAEKHKGARIAQVVGNLSVSRPMNFPHVERGTRAQIASSKDRGQFVPLSYTQVDKDVLNELPEDVKQELMEILPARQAPAPLRDPETSNLKCTEYHQENTDVDEKAKGPRESVKCVSPNSCPMIGLWHGQPPKWVLIFEDDIVVSSAMLRFLASQHREGQNRLSGILLSLVSYLSCESSGEQGTEQSEILLDLFSEWVKQYSQDQAQQDLEELHTVLRLVKRLASKSKLWEAVHDQAATAVQSAVGEVYGAKLNVR